MIIGCKTLKIMNELDLYKFINNNNIEYHWIINDNNDNDVIIFLSFSDLEDFNKILPNFLFDLDSGGIECIMNKHYITLNMREICEDCDINMERIFNTKD